MFRSLLLLSLALFLVMGCASAPVTPIVQTVVVPQTVIVQTTPPAVPTSAPVVQTVLVPQTVVVAATPAPSATSAASATAPGVAVSSVPIPTIPEPAAVTLDSSTTAFLVLDITSVVCTPRKSCVASLPAIAALLKKARDGQVPVIYSDTATAGSTILTEVAPQSGEPKVTGRADKFFGTNLDDLLKQKGTKTAVIVGSASNGAVLYTSFEANVRGYTVVVAQDGISTDDAFAQFLTRYQLLNQPGFANAQNKPLAAGVTLSRSDLITFK